MNNVGNEPSQHPSVARVVPLVPGNEEPNVVADLPPVLQSLSPSENISVPSPQAPASPSNHLSSSGASVSSLSASSSSAAAASASSFSPAESKTVERLESQKGAFREPMQEMAATNLVNDLTRILAKETQPAVRQQIWGFIKSLMMGPEANEAIRKNFLKILGANSEGLREFIKLVKENCPQDQAFAIMLREESSKIYRELNEEYNHEYSSFLQSLPIEQRAQNERHEKLNARLETLKRAQSRVEFLHGLAILGLHAAVSEDERNRLLDQLDGIREMGQHLHAGRRVVEGRIDSIQAQCIKPEPLEELAETKENWHAAVLTFTELNPINSEDPITLEEIAPENRIVVSSGHQFDLPKLIEYHNTRDYLGREWGEQVNSKWLINLFTNKPFDNLDVHHILEACSRRNPPLAVSDLMEGTYRA